MSQHSGRANALGAAAVLLALAAAACTGDRVVAPARDLRPPTLRVVSPTDSAYDLDGDSLVDLELDWTDSVGVVCAAGVRVRALTGVNGASDTANLLEHWRVARQDGVGLIAHETLGYLLHGGVNRLEVTVPDTAGNIAVDTVAFTLPHAALLKTIATGITGGLPATGIALCNDDRRVYMPVGGNLVIVNADSLRLVQVVPEPNYGLQLWNPLCVPGDPVLYVTSDYAVQRFDRAASRWLEEAGPYGSAGITQSPADSDLLYVGWLGGTIGTLSRNQHDTVGHYLIPLALVRDFYNIWALAALAGDSKIYAAQYYNGIWAVDPRRNVVLDSISVGDSSYYGESQSVALTRDGAHLYAAVTYGYPRGLAEIDTRTGKLPYRVDK